MSLERVERCPVCLGASFTPFLVCKDNTQTGEMFHVEQCSSCQLLVTNPRPPASSASRYYQSEEYISHTSTSRGLINSIYLIIRRLTIRWKYGLIKPYLKSTSILDIGCGTGEFLNHCSRKGAKVFGVEPAEKARLQVERLNIPVTETIDQLPAQTFSVVTLWHVLEHLYNLEQNLAAISQRLTEGGTIFIAVPNRESPDAGHYKEMWAAYDVPRHLWHFSKNNMRQLLERAGLKVKRIIPMKLDAYYVSMLSEKYKSDGQLSISALLKAISVASRSNARAKREMNYSSLVYVAQK